MLRSDTKAVRVIEAIDQHPDFDDRRIAKKVGCTRAYVAILRKKMVHVPEVNEPLDTLKEEPMLPLDLNDAPTQEELDEVLEAASILNPSTLDEVLNERGSRYGSFLKHAIITQRFKAVMSDTPNWIKLDDDMVEALEMVAHKMGRILNGDPTYADSWVDIAGYAQLVADRLQGKER
jgi:hypothetical protein